MARKMMLKICLKRTEDLLNECCQIGYKWAKWRKPDHRLRYEMLSVKKKVAVENRGP
jgi:hypothetical protein